MAVRLLAGPFKLRDNKNVPLPNASTYSWYPGMGLLFTSGFFYLYVATLDGVAELVSFLHGYTFSWWPVRRRVVTMSGGQESQWEPTVLIYSHTAPEDQLTAHSIAQRYVKLLDRRIFVNTSSQDLRAQVGSNPSTVELPHSAFVAAGMTVPTEVLPGRNEHDVFIRQGADRGCFYDTQAKVIASPTYHVPSGAEFLCYCPEYGVLLTAKDAGSWHELSVWALEVNPTTLTNPVPIVGTPATGQLVTFQVRCIGDDADPAIGELVDWSLSGVGVLLDLQTKTDDQGYATARVAYLLGEEGDSTVSASVSC